MAPAIDMIAALRSRAICPSGYYYSDGFCYRNSNWYGWGRWVLLGVIVFVFFLFMLIMSRRVRRQRRQGVQPVYGTSWMGWGQNQNPQYNNQQAYAPPPQYSQQPPQEANYTGGTYNSNQGYYGNAGTYNNDVPLQQPGSTYYPPREVNDYAPPEGPPPSKK
ncbi:hypothetical protein SEUCBS139899_007484 [Sporothrix eucalyptigena]|uniref:Chitin synthesis regulation, Congo red resistance, RCR protein n=1 Tax=Sporothrix eucalyptigena TaxID=1812306 RepID=A0ABP0C9C1_9PEZI